ncbi:PEP-CTERM protein-sorting domain-containing protein [Terrimicrobium sacchariphilum]|uniref:PEP-CTERM protein-sorting domain-containing protein n=1 Tax=Terrimicrobium sacchariphilum TaxID=690879 RepID=A0A146GDA9_TERSA|nr:hypothetical protein [Terrimicrobium sacchariphilum]GAT34657.1 PEP-CTERM protein-sorting domain-containing protein [Terrimicrobium sacchariphilum]
MHAQTLISDSFDLNGTTRTAGGNLNGLPPEVGSGTWYSNAKFGADGGATVANTGVDSFGLISFTNPGTTLTAQASVITVTSGWISVGFQHSSTNSNWFDSSNSLLFGLLTPTGGWQLKNGATLVASGTLSNFTSTNPYTLELVYNPTTAIAGLLINGINVSGNRSVTLSKSIGSSGFFIYGNGSATTSALATDFSVVAVPEPSPKLLVMMGLLLGMLILRRGSFRS